VTALNEIVLARPFDSDVLLERADFTPPVPNPTRPTMTSFRRTLWDPAMPTWSKRSCGNGEAMETGTQLVLASICSSGNTWCYATNSESST
jgi:hypothetical protein